MNISLFRIWDGHGRTVVDGAVVGKNLDTVRL